MNHIPLWVWFLLTMGASASGATIAAFVRTWLDNKSRERRHRENRP